MNDKQKLDTIIGLIEDCGHVEGAHHNQWMLDQIMQIALGKRYDAWIAKNEHWGKGIAP
jgi:hypothetical protein